MKKALKLLLMYFLAFILATFAGVVFYTIYLNIQGYVAGTEFNFFQRDVLLRALFYVLYCVIIFICPLMVYSRISNKGGAGHFITFILLCCLTWLLFIPLTVKLENKVYYSSKDSSKKLTSGYFRQDGDKIYYFTTDYNVNPFIDTTTIVIDTKDEGDVSIQKLASSRDFILFRNSAPYSDVLIKNIFDEGLISTPFISFSLIVNHAKDSLNKGWTFYLGFLSLGLLLCSLYGAAELFRWKLLNTGFLLSATGLILTANTLYFHPMVVSFCRQYINGRSFFLFLSRYVDYPLLVLVNVVFSLVFIIIGIVRFATRKKRSY